MSISGERAYDLLEKIAFTRTAGSQEELRAANILLDEIRSIGLDGTLESFSVDDTDFSTVEFHVTEPYDKSYVVTGFKHSRNTPPEGVDADFLYIGNLTKELLPGCEGKVVLCNDILCDIKDLSESGIVAFVRMDGKAIDDPSATDLNLSEFRSDEDKGLMTAFTIRARDALEIVKLGARRVHVCLINEAVTRTSHNVVTTIQGTEIPNEIVALGAHYDSTPFGHGACDNGAGSVCLMELLRYFAGNLPKRTLRFIWFGAEEVGLVGSKEYLRAHEAELKDYKLMINLDVGGSIMGQNFVRATCEESVAHYLQFLACEVGYQADIKQGLMGSDSTPFAHYKVPSVGFGRGEASGFQVCHSRHDTMEYIAPGPLEEVADFVRIFAERMICAEIFPIPQTIPDNIVERVSKRMGKDKDKE